MPLMPEETYVQLCTDGSSRKVSGGDEFWSLPPGEMAKFEEGWLISEFVCSEDWPNWEMHPNGDEFVYVLSGEVELLLEFPQETTRTRISSRGAVLVPRGVWHTARVFAPSRMFFVTRGAGTQHRPVSGA